MSNSNQTRRAVLKTAGVVTVGLAAYAGTAAAHFPDDLAIDVDPGSEENRINPRSGGVTNVAVLSNDAFDPLDADVRYEFGAPEAVEDGDGAAPVRRCVRDANGDGRNDLVLQFRTDDCGFDGDESEAELRWYKNEEREHGLSGVDDVTLVGRR